MALGTGCAAACAADGGALVNSTEIPADVMRGYVESFGQQCIDIARELAAQGDIEAQELLEKVEGQTQEVAA